MHYGREDSTHLQKNITDQYIDKCQSITTVDKQATKDALKTVKSNNEHRLLTAYCAAHFMYNSKYLGKKMKTHIRWFASFNFR